MEGDIVTGPDNVDAILLGQETLACHKNKKVVIQRITEESVETVIIAPNTEIINLPEKEDIFIADDGIENARSIGSGLEIRLFQECRSRGSSEDCLNIRYHSVG